MPNLKNPVGLQEIKAIQKKVHQSIKFKISSERSGQNLETIWQSEVNSRLIWRIIVQKGKLTSVLQSYLKLLQIIDTKKEQLKVTAEKADRIAQDIKEQIPKNYTFNYLPLRLSITDSETIMSILSQKFSEFYLAVKTRCVFTLVVKLFPFPNGVTTLRIIIGYVCKVEVREIE